MTSYEKKLEIGLKLNDKLKKFAEDLSPEEQQGLNTVLKLAENTILNTPIALFGVENKKDIIKIRRKLIEQHCDEELESFAASTNRLGAIATGVTITTTMVEF